MSDTMREAVLRIKHAAGIYFVGSFKGPQDDIDLNEAICRELQAAQSQLAPPVPQTVQGTGLTLPKRIAELIEQHGSLRAVARVIDCDPGYLSRLQSGERDDPGNHLLRRIGLRQIVIYERIKP